MQSSAARLDNALNKEYRRTFGEYAAKLETLQRLTETGADSKQIETATADVENARRSYNSARDRLANQLAGVAPTEGRPEGSAERDWRHAEQLICRAYVSCG
jgi:hypothetical protein